MADRITFREGSFDAALACTLLEELVPTGRYSLSDNDLESISHGTAANSPPDSRTLPEGL